VNGASHNDGPKLAGRLQEAHDADTDLGGATIAPSALHLYRGTASRYVIVNTTNSGRNDTTSRESPFSPSLSASLQRSVQSHSRLESTERRPR